MCSKRCTYTTESIPEKMQNWYYNFKKIVRRITIGRLMEELKVDRFHFIKSMDYKVARSIYFIFWQYLLRFWRIDGLVIR